MLVDRRRTVWFVFIFALAILFALQWGPGSMSSRSPGDEKVEEFAATVNGKELPLREFAVGYQNQLAGLRQQGIPPELAKQFGMHKQILDQLVNNELLSQAAEARGLIASDSDVRDLLMKQEQFKTNGQFDFEKYRQMISDYERMNEVAYEAKLRRTLSAQRLLEVVESGAAVSDDEVRAKYQKEGNTAKATFVKFLLTNAAAKVPAVKPAEADAWAKNNAAAVSAYYESNKANYFQPEKAKARQILLRVDRNETAAKKEEIKAKAEGIRKDLVDNKRVFADIAKQVSEDPLSKEKGGDLGEVERLALPTQFADVLFALEPNQVSVVVETPIGFHIGTVESKKAGVQKALTEVQREIATALLTKERWPKRTPRRRWLT
jgi:peptidyl-prolyl cis-trans isomerase D